MKIYISLPITGCNVNIQRSIARRYAWFVGATGHEAINPFDVEGAPVHYGAREQYAHFMGRDIEKLLLVDAVLFCPGWERSRGCRLERQVALIYGIRIVTLADLLFNAAKSLFPSECRHCDLNVPWDHSCTVTGAECQLLFGRQCLDFAPKAKLHPNANPTL